MNNLNWGLLLFVLLVVVLIQPLKVNLREYHCGGSGCGSGHGRGRGSGNGRDCGCGCGGAKKPLYYGYDEDYYYVLPKYFPFPLGY